MDCAELKEDPRECFMGLRDIHESIGDTHESIGESQESIVSVHSVHDIYGGIINWF